VATGGWPGATEHKAEVVESLFANLDGDTARAALVRIAASVEIASLLHEIESSTSRISDLVGAIKEYTHMDQAPVQNVDVVKSLETTLTILNHKLKQGVAVQRDYQKVPLLVNSFGSELNQVWTNIIDNAIDAMHGKASFASEPTAKTVALWLRLAITVPEFQRRCSPTSSSLFSPPKELEKARASAWIPSSEL
jgi:signal transduction histidine kinase